MKASLGVDDPRYTFYSSVVPVVESYGENASYPRCSALVVRRNRVCE